MFIRARGRIAVRDHPRGVCHPLDDKSPFPRRFGIAGGPAPHRPILSALKAGPDRTCLHTGTGHTFPRSDVRKPLPSLALLFAWLCANGALLDVVQVFAWAKMFSGYAESMSVSTALRKTFDPSQRCELCLGVAAARESTQDQVPQTVEHTAEKLLLTLHRPVKVVLTPPAVDWPPAHASAAPTRREDVPVPPPRV